MAFLSFVFVTGGSGSTVTVPTGAKGVIAFIEHYVASTSSTLNTVSLGGAGTFTVPWNIAVSGSVPAQAVAWADISSTGS